MSSEKLPVSGEALARSTKQYIDTSYEQVRQALEWDFLPEAIKAIWENLPEFESARAEREIPIAQVRDICHILVTFPGSTAVRRISDVLINNEIETTTAKSEKAALEIFNLTMRYVRVQNLARHIRTAVNSHLRVLGIESSSSDSRGSEYERNMESIPMTDSMREQARNLRQSVLSNQKDVNDWASEVNGLLSTYSRVSLSDNFYADSSRRFSSGARSVRGAVAEGGLKSYRLRFKQALAAALAIDLTQKEVGIEKTSSKSIETLLHEFANDPKDYTLLYERLQALRPRQSGRQNTRRVEWTFQEQTLGAENPKKNLLKHVLSIDGREFVIEGSRGGFTDDMITGVLKTVSIQLMVNPEAKELQAAFENRGHILRIEIERPKKTDHKRLKEILLQLI